jgi:signal transduction histidine kinase
VDEVHALRGAGAGNGRFGAALLADPQDGGPTVLGIPVVDVVLTVSVAAIGLSSLMARSAIVREDDDGPLHFADPDLTGGLLVVLGAAPLLARQRAAMLVLAATTLIFAVYQRLGYAPPPLPLGPLVALYTVAVTAAARIALGVSAALVVAVAALSVTHHTPLTDDDFFIYVISIVGAWALGSNVRLNKLWATVAAERAEQLVAERERETAAALVQERARIARDLHDVVTHHVTLMVALAAAARIRHEDAAVLETTLGQIEASGREATVEMRRMLDVLDPGHPNSGQTRLAVVPALLEKARHAGLKLRFEVRGEPRVLPATVDFTAFRIIQACVANALEHAKPASIGVIVEYRAGELGIHIRDDARAGEGTAEPAAPAGNGASPGGSTNGAEPGDGPGPERRAAPSGRRGRGLVGLAVRTMSVGGQVDVVPARGGGFEVNVTLPAPEATVSP